MEAQDDKNCQGNQRGGNGILWYKGESAARPRAATGCRVYSKLRHYQGVC